MAKEEKKKKKEEKKKDENLSFGEARLKFIAEHKKCRD